MADYTISEEVRQLEAYSDELNRKSKDLLDAFNAVVAERNALLRIVQGLGIQQPSAIIDPSVLTGTGPSTEVAPSRPETERSIISKKKKRAVRKTASK